MAGEAEREVRAAWEHVELVGAYGDLYAEHVRILDNSMFSIHTDWHAALAFTRQRQQEIAEIEEEMLAVEKQYKRMTGCGVYMSGEPKEVRPLSRTILRLEAIRAELKRGMKGEQYGTE